MSEVLSRSPVDALIQQIAETHRARLEDVKAHQEALEAARHDVQRLARVLAMLQAEEAPAIEIADVVAVEVPLSVPHTIDVGAVARALPRTNPFAERPASLPYAMWEVMQAGDAWHVAKDLMPALALARPGYSCGESTIYNIFRRESTVFEGSNGTYRVTAAYRAPHGHADA